MGGEVIHLGLSLQDSPGWRSLGDALEMFPGSTCISYLLLRNKQSPNLVT